MGEQIRKNLDAWLDLAKRFKNFLERHTRARRLDPIGADLILLAEMQERVGTIDNLDRLFETEIAAWEVDWYPEESFERRPERLYLRGFKVNGSTIVIAGLTSPGAIAFWHQYENEFRMLLATEGGEDA